MKLLLKNNKKYCKKYYTWLYFNPCPSSTGKPVPVI